MAIKEIKLALNNNVLDYYRNNKKSINELINSFKREAIEKSKPNRCFLCGKKCTSFCNSHSIPRVCLKNISSNGKVLQSLLLDKMPIVKTDLGLNEAGTFHIICNECDNNSFKEYENEKKYGDYLPSSVQMAQIATKNLLVIIGKRLVEKELYLIMEEISLRYEFNKIVKTLELDLFEYESSFKRAKQALNGNHESFFYCFYYRKLDYVVPYACQSSIALETDLDGNIINQVYNQSADIKIRSMHIAVLPFNSYTIVMMFIDTADKRYRQFYKQFNKLEENDKLAVLNFVVFAYTENVFVSKDLNESVYEDKELIDLCARANMFIADDIDDNPKELSKEAKNFEKRHCIPNLLLKKYCLHKSKVDFQ